jgi:hypothetical protein
MDRLAELPAAITKLMEAQLAAHVARFQADWKGLCNVGGRRDDHAAVFLDVVRRDVDDLAALCGRISSQLQKLIADPFGDKED